MAATPERSRSNRPTTMPAITDADCSLCGGPLGRTWRAVAGVHVSSRHTGAEHSRKFTRPILVCMACAQNLRVEPLVSVGRLAGHA